MARKRERKSRNQEWSKVFGEVRKRVGFGLAFYGHTQKSLAESAGVSAGTIGRIVRGDSKNMFLSTMYKLAVAFEVTPNWMMAMDSIELLGKRRAERRMAA